MEKTDGLEEVISQWWHGEVAPAHCKDLTSAIRTYISGCLPQEKEVEYLPDGITPDYDISQSEEGFNACLKSVREALKLGEGK